MEGVEGEGWRGRGRREERAREGGEAWLLTQLLGLWMYQEKF